MEKETREAAFDLAKELSKWESVSAVILFGSAAREETKKESDLDFFIVLEKRKEKGKLGSIINQISRKYNKTIQAVFANQSFSGLDHNFLENVFREGVVLYNKRISVQAGQAKLEPFLLLNYTLEKVSPETKNKLNRILYGHKTRKRVGKKDYVSRMEGILKKYGGWKVGLASFIVPFKKAKIFLNLFKDKQIRHHYWEIWLSPR